MLANNENFTKLKHSGDPDNITTMRNLLIFEQISLREISKSSQFQNLMLKLLAVQS